MNAPHVTVCGWYSASRKASCWNFSWWNFSTVCGAKIPGLPLFRDGFWDPYCSAPDGGVPGGGR